MRERKRHFDISFKNFKNQNWTKNKKVIKKTDFLYLKGYFICNYVIFGLNEKSVKVNCRKFVDFSFETNYIKIDQLIKKNI